MHARGEWAVSSIRLDATVSPAVYEQTKGALDAAAHKLRTEEWPTFDPSNAAGHTASDVCTADWCEANGLALCCKTHRNKYVAGSVPECYRQESKAKRAKLKLAAKKAAADDSDDEEDEE